jgi:hypothetical protein
MDMTRRLLKPETYRSIPERDQSPVVPTYWMKLAALCEAYRGADHTTAYYKKNQKNDEAQIAAASRDRFYSQLKPLLDQLIID